MELLTPFRVPRPCCIWEQKVVSTARRRPPLVRLVLLPTLSYWVITAVLERTNLTYVVDTWHTAIH